MHRLRNSVPPPTKKKNRSILARIEASKAYNYIGGWLYRITLQLLYATLRIECKGLKPLSHPCIVALWHNQLALAMLVRRYLPKYDCSVVISNSRDGMILGSYVKTHAGCNVIHASHKSGHSALLQIIDELKQNRMLIITPDGPRGPLYEVKGGVVFSAQKAEAMIVPMHWHASSMWQLGTWDRLQFPKPFSKVTLYFEDPILCTQGSDREAIRALLKEKLST